jgi:hypothetical protein
VTQKSQVDPAFWVNPVRFRFGVEAGAEADLDLAEEVHRRPAARTETNVAQGWPEL